MSEIKEVKVIKNLGVLSVLSNEDADVLNKADYLKNIGCLVVKEDFYARYPNLGFKNIGNTVIVPKDAEVSMATGELTIDKEYLEALTKPVYIIIVGVLIVKSDIDKNLFAEKISGISLTGVVVCPESIVGVISSKQKSSTSISITYKDDEKVNMVVRNGNIVINNNFFESLGENNMLFINGNASILDLVDSTEIKGKVKQIIVNGTLKISEENQKSFEGSLMVNGKTIVVPKGYEYIGADLTLSESNITQYAGRNIFTTKTVTFDESLTNDMVNANKFSLNSKRVICKKDIESSVSAIIAGSTTEKVVYDNMLITNYGKRKLTAKELSYTKQPMHILNFGNLEIDENIDDDILFEKISNINNYGMITCSEENYGVIQMKTTVNKGNIITHEEATAKKTVNEIVLMANMGNVNL